ncbi:MAG: 2-C-methyl-D-erythritol 4-phosphate cytidylyltransferase [Planctomycetes bacterium]|nr:2-C-methyl-D-erythritol 4-phosphate cytidylyltransferase [Planctomycetota bacterium]
MTCSTTAAAVLVAAGNSTRMGGALRKPHLVLAGRSILEHTCAAFAAVPAVRELVLVVHEGDLERVTALAAGGGAFAKVRAIVAGGRERTDSVRVGVEAVGPTAEVVLVHDAARPLIRPETIEAAIEVAARDGAALVAVPVRDTLKSAPDGSHSVATVDRSTIWAAQTPQAFRASIARELFARAAREKLVATDDAALYERFIGPVTLVHGEWSNLKITSPEDLAIAEAMLAWRAREAHA